MLCCTHTHSAPASMPFRGVMGLIDEAWLARTSDAIVALVSTLPERLAPAQLAGGTTTVAGIGYNRQDPSRSASDALRVLAVESLDGARIATLLHYATHAVVLGPRNLQFSADFPGAAAHAVVQRHGGVAIYLQGACGDIDPLVYRERGWGTGTFDDCAGIGEQLADGADAALAGAPRTPAITLAAHARETAIPLDPPPRPDERAALAHEFEAQRVAALQPPANRVDELCATAMLQWADELSRALACGRLPSELRAETSVFRLGDVVIAGAPFELYSDIARSLEHALAPRLALCTGYANGLYGYCPSRWAKEQGGYGADSSCRWFPALLTPLAAGADQVLVDAMLSGAYHQSQPTIS